MCMIMDSLAGSGDIVFVFKRRKKKAKIKKKKSVLTFDHFPEGEGPRGSRPGCVRGTRNRSESQNHRNTRRSSSLQRGCCRRLLLLLLPANQRKKKQPVAERLSGLTGIWSLERVAQLGLLPAGKKEKGWGCVQSRRWPSQIRLTYVFYSPTRR